MSISGRVWTWAGTWRQTGKNIGVEVFQIPTSLKDLLDDTAYWIQHNTYEIDEIAARFHHRLVFIHPYPNGNGRHARLATDLLLRSLDRRPFTWGSETFTHPSDIRARYVEVLRAADKYDYAPLLGFVRG